MIKQNSDFSNLFGILIILFLVFMFWTDNLFSLSQNDENSVTNILFDDYFPLITVEYESDSTIVLKGDENSLLIINGTLAPLWNAIDIVKNNGYKLKEIIESGMGSQGNPTRFYAILEKEKVGEKIQLLDKKVKYVQEKTNQTYEDSDQTKPMFNFSKSVKKGNNTTNIETIKNKDILYYNYTNNILGIELQYPSNWYLNKEDNKINSLCMEKVCDIVFYRNLKSIGTDNNNTNINSVRFGISSGSINSQGFKEKCKCYSLLEFVQFFYKNFLQNKESSFLLNDNETTISGNISGWQLEFDIANPNSNNGLQQEGKMWAILTINNNAYYILGYTTDKKLYDKYLPEAKKIIGSIEFIPTQEIKKIIQPSFMTSTDLD